MNPTAREKIYPFHYPEAVIDILKQMSFSEGKAIRVIGSAADRRMLYSADYDVNEVVKVSSFEETTEKLQDIVRTLVNNHSIYIGDIKAGIIEEWMPVKGEIKDGRVIGYNAKDTRQRLDALNDILTSEERKVKIYDNPTPLQFLKIFNDLRIGIVRWTPNDILTGYKILRDGRKYTLLQALSSPSLTKVDVIAYTTVPEERFIELSIIYTFMKDGNFTNRETGKEYLLQTLRESIAILHHDGDYFKMAKRIYSMAKLLGNDKAMDKLAPFFNSDVGRLYSIYSDMSILSSLYENGRTPKKEQIKNELNTFKVRLGYIRLHGFVEEQKIPTTAEETNKVFRDLQTKIKEKMEAESVKMLKKLHLLPLPPFLRI